MINFQREIGPFKLAKDDGIHLRYHWNGWWIDLWTDCGIAGLYHETRTTVLEFGPAAELAVRAAEMEAQHER